MSYITRVVWNHRATQAYGRQLMSLLSNQSVTALNILVKTTATEGDRELSGRV
jgi:hypothetical protein